MASMALLNNQRGKNTMVFNHPILVGGLEHFLFFHILGMSSFQLTKSIIFQRGRAQPPTSIKCPASRAAIPAIPHAIHHGVT